ncbi:hypothetical protein K7432_014171 [Basidiobolus ranarum]|uniref:Gamma-glutamyltranspeptidase n=1 Tax=Basidiobolus ranarum TaxID=34480 RepID=A0ABR2VQR4_9FUNG
MNPTNTLCHSVNESSSVGKVTLATGKNGVVSADSQICSEAGVQILKSNGNAIDAAIATALCLGTVNSFSSGIGGGGFMTIRTSNGTVDFINFRETAPAGASTEMFKDKPDASQVRGLAIGIPEKSRVSSWLIKNTVASHGISCFNRRFDFLVTASQQRSSWQLNYNFIRI